MEQTNHKKVLTLKSKTEKPVVTDEKKAAAIAAQQAFMASTTRFDHSAKYGRYSY